MVEGGYALSNALVLSGVHGKDFVIGFLQRFEWFAVDVYGEALSVPGHKHNGKSIA